MWSLFTDACKIVLNIILLFIYNNVYLPCNILKYKVGLYIFGLRSPEMYNIALFIYKMYMKDLPIFVWKKDFTDFQSQMFFEGFRIFGIPNHASEMYCACIPRRLSSR